ncbi:SDR family NAD(P)-dependent oxidoreductase [Pseudonocardia alaniniphila]|uniref:SDR family NAD(P)-dependent oxidoreductase n=1 Tax=Pseudonocardia alaniniphila TaxID=75291 RepID=A0ABS9TL06_9PSEU|nr:SDR family NAD(P)-dependent oxidoreductase [Pseudonocardia alaniniphila]MCH6169200.1 SDR family NAD(P)-dependent oxidoreductase [Pseudonocardia alaniniphila]
MTDPTTQPNSRRTWLVTGATSGIGRELVAQVLASGDQVTAVARRSARLGDLTEKYAGTVLAIDADVRNEDDMQRVVDATVESFGRIDVVANNAGYGLFGAVEEAGDEQARAIFDTNVFGVLNVLRAALPVLRRQRSGHVLQGSSFYGQFAHPGVGLLAATKYAVEGLSDALVSELEPLGIRVTIVQPAPTATSFLDNLEIATPIGDYDRTVRQVQAEIDSLPPGAFVSAEQIAAGIITAVDSDRAPLRLALGSSGANAMRTALNARLDDLDDWAAVTDGVLD